MSAFKTGQTYSTRSIGDADCKIELTILRRTDCTVVALSEQFADHRKVKTLRVVNRDGIERVAPWGNYSMAPIVRADRVAT
jgi:hypothetical protein